MTRPRIAAIVSAIIASTAAFLVASRWGLIGTAAGAAIVPAVYTLVSHFSTESLEKAGRWARRRVRPGDGGTVGASASGESQVQEGTETATAVGLQTGTARGDESPATEPGVAAEPRVAPEPRVAAQPRGQAIVWMLAIVAVLSLAVSVYAVTTRKGETERVIQERVVEKTVIVTVEGESQPAPSGDGGSTQTGVTSTTTSTTTTDPSSTTTSSSAETSSSTTTSAPAEPVESSSTTRTVPETTVTTKAP